MITRSSLAIIVVFLLKSNLLGQVPRDTHVALSVNIVKPLANKNAISAVRDYGTSIRSGSLIVNSHVLQKPYQMALSENELFVNDKLVATFSSARDQPHQDITSLASELAEQFDVDNTVIVFDEQHRLVMDCENAAYFLCELANAKSLSARVVAASDHSTVALQHEPITKLKWQSLLADFHVSDSLQEHFTTLNCTMDDEITYEESRNFVQERQVTRSNQMYGLTIVGMILAVLAVGTILEFKPDSTLPWSEKNVAKSALAVTRKIIGLIVLLSVFDLFATIFTNASGGFEELNPLGDSLLSNTYGLSAFKIAATFVGTSILWLGRQYAGIQKAAWWMCLTLSIVTIRWLAVGSLFYT